MSTPVRPGVYIGSLRHRRTAPVTHAFTYPLFMVLLDIDRIPALMRASAFASHNRWNWAAYHDADHLGDPSLPLRTRLALDAARSGHTLPDGPIFLLTHLRYLGYGFNPVSFFYCYDAGGTLCVMLAEVNNTFGGSHTYWLEPDASTEDKTGVMRASAAKSFYVSPFMPADMQYAFAFTEPGDRLVAHMALERSSEAGTPHVFDATLTLDYRPWDARELRRALLRHPFMTATVIAGIHWQALRLWWKGLPIVPRSTPTGVYPDCVPSDGAVAMSKQ